MHAIRLLTDNENLSLFYEVNFLNYLDLPLEWISDHSQLAQELKEDHTLIIIDGESANAEIKELLLNHPLKNPVFYFGNDFAENQVEGLSIFKSPVNLQQVLKTAARLLKITARDMASKPKGKYLAFDVKFLKVCQHAPVDIFKDAGNLYELILGADQVIPATFWQSQDSLNDFYIRSHERLIFANALSDMIITSLQKENKITEMQSSAVSYEIFQRYIQNVGLDAKAIEMAERTIKLIEQTIKKSSEPVTKLMAKVFDNKDSYIFAHSALISYLSCHILEQVSWGNDEHQKKMIYASFFHDVVLNNHDHAKIHSEEALAKYGFDENEQQAILSHALRASKLVKKIPLAPMGCDLIIKQHHGAREGVGFPHKIPAGLPPLSTLFYITESLAHEILENDQFQQEQGLDGILQSFEKPSRQVLEVIQLFRLMRLGNFKAYMQCA